MKHAKPVPFSELDQRRTERQRQVLLNNYNSAATVCRDRARERYETNLPPVWIMVAIVLGMGLSFFVAFRILFWAIWGE
jgi:hypothetical protein